MIKGEIDDERERTREKGREYEKERIEEAETERMGKGDIHTWMQTYVSIVVAASGVVWWTSCHWGLKIHCRELGRNLWSGHSGCVGLFHHKSYKVFRKGMRFGLFVGCRRCKNRS